MDGLSRRVSYLIQNCVELKNLTLKITANMALELVEFQKDRTESWEIGKNSKVPVRLVDFTKGKLSTNIQRLLITQKKLPLNFQKFSLILYTKTSGGI